MPYLWPKLAALLRVDRDELMHILSRPGQVVNSPRKPAARSDVTIVDERVRQSREEWLRVREARSPRIVRLAAQLYPPEFRVRDSHVLAGPGWLLDEPIELDRVRLIWSSADNPTPRLSGDQAHVLPLADNGSDYCRYSHAVRDLVRPRLMENRLSYRLLDVARTPGGLTLTFGSTTFFEAFDVKESLAHEFRAAWLRCGGCLPEWESLPLRKSISDPFDPRGILLSPGVITLTIRRDKWGEHRFMVHQRDGAAVADGGDMYSVMPGGEFQPSSVASVDVRNDFSLWRNIMREFSEEFLGNPEHDGGGPSSIDYARDEPFRSFEAARTAGRFRMWTYGLIMDPLTLGASQRTVAVVDDDVFDTVFASLVDTNDEGRVVSVGPGIGVPFTESAVDHIVRRMSASSAALLRFAWRDRDLLLR